MPTSDDDRYLRPPEARYENLELAARDYYRILNQIIGDEGLPKRYELLQLPPGSFALAGGPGEPDPAGGALAYDKSLTELAVGSALLPHSWEEQTPIRARLLWDAPDTGAGTVIWELDYYLWGASGAALPAASTQTLTATAPGVANQLVATEFPSLSASAMAIGGLVLVGVRRKLGSYANDANLRMVDILYRSTTRGSQLERTKYSVDSTGT